MADKLLDKVKEYAAELEAAGRSPGYAYATAWARACKYHGELDEQAHCRRPGREYLTRKTNRRILGHLHRRCKNLPDAGYVMYWAARKAGVTTEGVVHKGHLVLLYGGEAFAPSLNAPEAIETAVAEGTPYTAAKPAAAIAAMADRVVGVERRSNPAPEHQLSPTQRRKYLGKLEGAQRQARAAEIVERRKPSNRSNAPFATDAGQVTRRSSHARSFEQVYGRAPADVADAARLTGIPEAVLEQVYARGMAAWQTGHRPGASQHAWALARVQSFATGGPTALGPDADLAAKVQNPAGQTETPEFKRWFGDSKVVDAEGKPLVVYHGTGAMFWEFRDWRPAFFTPDREYANLYTSKGKKPRIIQAYLKIERPFDPAKDADALRLFNQVFLPYWQRRYPTLYQSKEMHPLRIGEPLPFTMADEVWTFLRKLQREGSSNYDGMCVYEGSGITHAPAWVPLQPTQIKSATANKGTFDPQDPDIRNPAGQTFNPRQPAQVQNPTVQEFSAIAERVARDVPVSKAKQYGEDVRALIAELRSLRAAKLTPLELLDATNSARAKIKKLRQEGDTLLHKLADMRPPQTDTMYWWVQADINVLRQAVPFNADLRDIEDMALFLAEKITGRVLAYAQEAQREVVKRQLERERTGGKVQNPNSQTETPAFKKWFGDSVVIDGDGKPLVVFHGTKGNFTQFSPAMVGTSDFGSLGRGYYFSEYRDLAEFYAKMCPGDGTPRVLSVYLSIQNPISYEELPHVTTIERSKAITKGLIDAGYDGVIKRDQDGRIVEVVAFYPTQIKSATSNRGTFDRQDADIRNPRQPAQVEWVAQYAQSHFDRPKVEPDDVRTHFNLNSGGYTIDTRTPKGWRMRDDSSLEVTMLGAAFEYQPAGHREYLASGRRNVHAWVYGRESHAPFNAADGWRQARYSKNPPCYIDMESGKCLPNDRSIDVHLGSRSNIDPATGKARPSPYKGGRAVKTLPTMWWRPRR